jgi:hypothetical protein
MCCTASIASRFSVSDTGSPALRSSTTKPARRSIIVDPLLLLLLPLLRRTEAGEHLRRRGPPQLRSRRHANGRLPAG